MSMLEPVDDGALHIEAISPVAVGSVWDHVRQYLRECVQLDYQDIRVEDVYTALRTGAATLHIGRRRKQIVGCMVTQPVADPYSGKPILHIWLVHGRMQARDGMPYVEDLARAIGARRITFTCPDYSYARLGQLWGFDTVRYECMKEI